MTEIFVEASHESISTLDEPVLVTLKRDALAVGNKMVAVVVPPLAKEEHLRDWDLWGPLFLCLLLALILSATAQSSQSGIIFSAVFLLVWVGGAVITLNAKFLGSTISFFQTVCVLGYCLAPLCLSAILALIIPWFWLNFVITLAAWGWACWASLRFFRGTVAEDREMLMLYPIGLFYFFIAWMVMIGV